MALVDEASPVFIARAMNTLASMFHGHEEDGDGVSGRWSTHELGRPPPVPLFGYGMVFPNRIPCLPDDLHGSPALEGVEARSSKRAHASPTWDAGTAHRLWRWPPRIPNSTFYGFDFHAPSIETCRERASEAGVTERPVPGREFDELFREIRPDLFLRLPS